MTRNIQANLHSHKRFLVFLHTQVMQNLEAELITELSGHNHVALLPAGRSAVRSYVRRVDILGSYCNDLLVVGFAHSHAACGSVERDDSA